MSQANAIAPVSEEKLPRRDWILLPLIPLLTICLIFVFTEWIARRMFIFYRDKVHRNLVASHGIYRRPRVGVQLQSTSLCKSK
jgi:hypothetical protein